MKSIFSFAIICAFDVSTVCVSGCSEPATTTPEAGKTEMKDDAEMKDKEMEKTDGDMEKAEGDMEKTESKGSHGK